MIFSDTLLNVDDSNFKFVPSESDDYVKLQLSVPRALAENMALLAAFVNNYSVIKDSKFEVKCINPWVYTYSALLFPNEYQFYVYNDTAHLSAQFDNTAIAYSKSADTLNLLHSASSITEISNVDSPITFMWLRDMCLAEQRIRDFKVSGIFDRFNFANIHDLKKFGIPEYAIVEIELVTDKIEAFRDFVNALGLFVCGSYRPVILNIISACKSYLNEI